MKKDIEKVRELYRKLQAMANDDSSPKEAETARRRMKELERKYKLFDTAEERIEARKGQKTRTSPQKPYTDDLPPHSNNTRNTGYCVVYGDNKRCFIHKDKSPSRLGACYIRDALMHKAALEHEKRTGLPGIYSGIWEELFPEKVGNFDQITIGPEDKQKPSEMTADFRTVTLFTDKTWKRTETIMYWVVDQTSINTSDVKRLFKKHYIEQIAGLENKNIDSRYTA